MHWRLLSTFVLLLTLLASAAAPAMAYDNGKSRGRKAGWGNCDLPPGQAKKHGCVPTRFRMVRFPVDRQIVVVRVPIDHRGWYWVDDRNRLWVDDRGFWLDDRALVRLSIVID